MRTSKFSGVFSGKASSRKGKQFYFVWDLGNGNFAIQGLDNAFVPVEKPRLLSDSALKSDFQYEPGILAAPITTPDFRHLSAPAPARHREVTELNDDALRELEKARKAKQVENDLRNNFDKALRALSRPRDRKGALAAIEQLAETRDGIIPAHKHMFRDFGVSLRKKSLPELALACARRAVELAPNDDHAHFNLARLLGMLGMYDEADAHLDHAIKLNRKEKVYERLGAWLRNERGFRGK